MNHKPGGAITVQPKTWMATATSSTVMPTAVIDFRPYQNASKLGAAFAELIRAMLDTERELKRMRGES